MTRTKPELYFEKYIHKNGHQKQKNNDKKIFLRAGGDWVVMVVEDSVVGSGGASVVVVVVIVVDGPFSPSTVQENSTDLGEGTLNWVELVWMNATS